MIVTSLRSFVWSSSGLYVIHITPGGGEGRLWGQRTQYIHPAILCTTASQQQIICVQLMMNAHPVHNSCKKLDKIQSHKINNFPQKYCECTNDGCLIGAIFKCTMQTVQIHTSGKEKSFIIIHVNCCRAYENSDDSINSPFTRYKIVISVSEGSVVSDI